MWLEIFLVCPESSFLSTSFSRLLKNKTSPLKPHQLQRNSCYEKDQPELFSHLIKRNLSCSNLSFCERKYKSGWVSLSSLRWLTAARESLVPHRHKSRHSPSSEAFMDWTQKWQHWSVTGSRRSQGTFSCTYVHVTAPGLCAEVLPTRTELPLLVPCVSE